MSKNQRIFDNNYKISTTKNRKVGTEKISCCTDPKWVDICTQKQQNKR